jgi:hypothetical protein
MLEGGYNPPVLAECVEVHLRGLLADEIRAIEAGDDPPRR